MPRRVAQTTLDEFAAWLRGFMSARVPPLNGAQLAAYMSELGGKKVEQQSVSTWLNARQRPSAQSCTLIDKLFHLPAGTAQWKAGYLAEEPRDPVSEDAPKIRPEARAIYDEIQERLPSLSPLQMQVVVDLMRGLQRLPSEVLPDAAARRPSTRRPPVDAHIG